MTHQLDKKQSSSPPPLIPMLEQVKWERTTESRISTVIRLLPASLQPRIGSFGGQFRRTSSLGSIRATAEIQQQEQQQQQQLVPKSSPPTPPRPVSAPEQAAKRSSWSMMESSSPSSTEVSAALDRIVIPETGVRANDRKQQQQQTGINWRLVDQGTSLVGIAADASDGDDAALSRKAYIDGLTYLLKSLPADLNGYEAEQVRAALPVQVSQRGAGGDLEQSNALRPYYMYPSGGGRSHRGGGDGRRRNSTVHRVVHALVLNMILVVHLVLPYVALLVKAAMSVERRYRMSETIIGHSMSAFHVAGRQCARAAEAVLTTTPSHGVSSTFVWTVEEITRGVSDGLGEGLLITRLRDKRIS